MSLAWLSLGALFIAIVVSCFTRLNVGVLAVAFAWIVGVYFGWDAARRRRRRVSDPVVPDARWRHAALHAGPVERHARPGGASLGPPVPRQHRPHSRSPFFLLGLGIASLGPGNVATAAMLAPMAMAVATRARIPPFLMALMVGMGAQAGRTLSVRAHRHHRQRPDGQDRPRRLRVAHVLVECRRPRRARVRRLCAARRREALRIGVSGFGGRHA